MYFVSGCSSSKQILDKQKILKLALPDSVHSSDPVNSYDTNSLEVNFQIYEGLYQYNYETSAIEPLLASAMPKVSKDRLRYIIPIRKDIYFHDDPCFKNGVGRQVTAHDFIYEWKRLADPRTESQGFWIFSKRIVGFSQYQEKFNRRPSTEVMKENIPGFKVLDDFTIEINLTQPLPQLLDLLVMHFTAPVPYEAIEMYGKDFVNHPVGTGPFKVKSWKYNSKIELVKNEKYREVYYKGKRLPFLDGIDFTIIKEEQPRWLGFLSNSLDQILLPKDNFYSAIDQNFKLRGQLQKKGIQLAVDKGVRYWYINFNMRDPVVGKSKYLRQAIASTINRELWLDIFKNNRGSVQTEVNPPIASERCGNGYKWEYNLERAKALLAKAGFPEGKGLPKLRFDTRNTSMSERQLAEFIAKSVKRIGIDVEVVVNTFPAYLEKWTKGNLQMNHSGYIPDFPDPENNFQMLYGPNQPPGSNEASFNNSEFDRLYLKMARMQPGKSRKKVICEMESIVQEELPWAYGVYEDYYRLTQKRVLNFQARELVSNKWKYVDIQNQEFLEDKTKQTYATK